LAVMHICFLIRKVLWIHGTSAVSICGPNKNAGKTVLHGS